MSVRRTLRRLERRHLRHRGAWWFAALFLVFGGTGLARGVSEIRPPQSAPATNTQASTRAPSAASRVAVLPLSALQGVSIGHSRLLPAEAPAIRDYDVTRKWPTQVLPQQQGLPDLFRDALGDFDLAHVLVWLLPLLVIGLSYDMLSREREQGTLALLLSQPVTAGSVLAAKGVVRLPWVVLPPLVLCAAAVAQHASELTTRDWALAVTAAVLVAAYAGFWLAVCAWVNTTGGSSTTNGLVLGLVWIALVVVVPPAIDASARARYVGPTAPEVQLQESYWQSGAGGDQEEYLQRLLRERPELGPAPAVSTDPYRRSYFGEDGGLQQAYRYYAYQDLASAMSRLAQRFVDRQQFVDRLRYLSPAAVLKESLDEVAGTHERRYRAFERQARAYLDDVRRFEWIRQFKLETLVAPGDPWNDTGKAALLNAVRATLDREHGPYKRPPFGFVEEQPGVFAIRFGAGLLGLLLPTVLLIALAARNVRRGAVIQA